ncbi:MAG: VOC family protein [Candidatus Hydrogenedentes bacterium]|nr:VOC family protein [Candidatus Hydrogenedentota bacterium]
MAAVGPIGRLNVIVLVVRVLQRSLRFYGETLGLPVQAQMGNWAYINAGGVTLALQHLPKADFPQNLYMSELVFRVEDIDAVHAALKQSGVTFINTIRQLTDKEFGISFRDPDGHVLTIMGPKKRL